MGNSLSQIRDHASSMLPNGSKRLSSDQLSVSTQVKVSTVCCIAWCYLGYKYMPYTVVPLPTLGDRLGFTIQWQLPSVMMMMAGVGEVASMRWRTKAINPFVQCEEEESCRFQIHRNYLANTTEQLILSAASQLILTTFLTEPQMRIIPLLTALFVVGRLTFWVGYLNKPTNRSFGFCMNGLTTVATLGVCGYFMVKNFCLGNGTLHYQ